MAVEGGSKNMFKTTTFLARWALRWALPQQPLPASPASKQPPESLGGAVGEGLARPGGSMTSGAGLQAGNGFLTGGSVRGRGKRHRVGAGGEVGGGVATVVPPCFADPGNGKPTPTEEHNLRTTAGLRLLFNNLGAYGVPAHRDTPPVGICMAESLGWGCRQGVRGEWWSAGAKWGPGGLGHRNLGG